MAEEKSQGLVRVSSIGEVARGVRSNALWDAIKWSWLSWGPAWGAAMTTGFYAVVAWLRGHNDIVLVGLGFIPFGLMLILAHVSRKPSAAPLPGPSIHLDEPVAPPIEDLTITIIEAAFGERENQQAGWPKTYIVLRVRLLSEVRDLRLSHWQLQLRLENELYCRHTYLNPEALVVVIGSPMRIYTIDGEDCVDKRYSETALPYRSEQEGFVSFIVLEEVKAEYLHGCVFTLRVRGSNERYYEGARNPGAWLCKTSFAWEQDTGVGTPGKSINAPPRLCKSGKREPPPLRSTAQIIGGVHD